MKKILKILMEMKLLDYLLTILKLLGKQMKMPQQMAVPPSLVPSRASRLRLTLSSSQGAHRYGPPLWGTQDPTLSLSHGLHAQSVVPVHEHEVGSSPGAGAGPRGRGPAKLNP